MYMEHVQNALGSLRPSLLEFRVLHSGTALIHLMHVTIGVHQLTSPAMPACCAGVCLFVCSRQGGEGNLQCPRPEAGVRPQDAVNAPKSDPRAACLGLSDKTTS